MATIEMVMPQMGESIIEGTILSWLKKEGETIDQDESVLEVATDKVDTEVPALHAGILKKILAKEGEVVGVGVPIALIETDDKSVIAPDKTVHSNRTVSEPIIPPFIPSHASPSSATSNLEDNRFYSPLVKNIAREEGISELELATIPGSGKEGRVTKQDMMEYLKNKPHSTHSKSLAIPPAGKSLSAEDEIVVMDRMRLMIAQRMLDSKRISAHVTSFVEADVTKIVLWRNKIKEYYMQKEGEPFTFTPIFVQAISKAIKDYPLINISVDGDRIIKKKDINIGVAVALPNGNLIVPVVKKADQLSLVGLSKKINDLARRARVNKLSPEELSGGTYTLSNVGSFGNIMGTPIIVQPQVAILAVGIITKKPAVIETPTGDAIAIRHKMFLSHSYDHRVIDGSLGGMFVRRVADYLEAFDTNTEL